MCSSLGNTFSHALSIPLLPVVLLMGLRPPELSLPTLACLLLLSLSSSCLGSQIQIHSNFPSLRGLTHRWSSHVLSRKHFFATKTITELHTCSKHQVLGPVPTDMSTTQLLQRSLRDHSARGWSKIVRARETGNFFPVFFQLLLHDQSPQYLLTYGVTDCYNSWRLRGLRFPPAHLGLFIWLYYFIISIKSTWSRMA